MRERLPRGKEVKKEKSNICANLALCKEEKKSGANIVNFLFSEHSG